MDPCPFVRILVANLALRFRSSSKSTQNQTNNSYHCKIKLNGFPSQFSTIQLLLKENDSIDNKIHACFSLNKLEFSKLVEKEKPSVVKIEVFGGGGKRCGMVGKLLGCVLIELDLKGTKMQNIGWVVVGKNGINEKKSDHIEMHVNVRGENDPRFVFEFDGEPECSPQVFQVNGNVKQPVFTSKFGFRNSGERNLRSRSSLSEPSTSTSCFAKFKSKEEQVIIERKGWSITIHDLCGSPVAAASMVTPFVPSQGTDRVSRSNPGAWLILRPGQGTWKPWGRLEAWCEGNDKLGYKFDLTMDGSVDTITLAHSTINKKKGGKFSIDISNIATPMTSPSSSFDFGSGSGSGGSGSDPGSGFLAQLLYRGFIMSSTVEGDGKCSKTEVEVGVQHVTCTEDAAVFVALAAAMDLSMDACRPFSQKLRKELRQFEDL